MYPLIESSTHRFSFQEQILKVRELNFWREEEEDETLVCIYISPHGKYLKI